MKEPTKNSEWMKGALENTPTKKQILDAMFKAAFGDKKIKILISNKTDLSTPVPNNPM